MERGEAHSGRDDLEDLLHDVDREGESGVIPHPMGACRVRLAVRSSLLQGGCAHSGVQCVERRAKTAARSERVKEESYAS